MIKSVTPETMAPPFARYAHGIADTQSGLVLTSGQLALDVDGTIPDGAQAQAQLIFSNIDEILAQAGTDKSHVLKVHAYVTDRSHMADYMAARDVWLADIPHLPASTLMIVSGFTRPEFVVEIEVTARLP
ncbi:enamine deaminase RidA (YjgF/YER057c/UK114 family) [Yoonia maritima]|uniref:Enamine deaminase RidA (YjgF/YER057c/UK114 family) n=1 Tax=Yoonia maritima TaxID=1435347 RepID=A0A2T0VY64_9RHOB|nr:RidA family protein [Yoonia maritima]PRY77210.1 enamine deaminase RidA (YjgF/YER057c/UK114 family) [Yoonia maritima]